MGMLLLTRNLAWLNLTCELHSTDEVEFENAPLLCWLVLPSSKPFTVLLPSPPLSISAIRNPLSLLSVQLLQLQKVNGERSYRSRLLLHPLLPLVTAMLLLLLLLVGLELLLSYKELPSKKSSLFQSLITPMLLVSPRQCKGCWKRTRGLESKLAPLVLEAPPLSSFVLEIRRRSMMQRENFRSFWQRM